MSREEVADFVSRSAFEKGRAYQAQGRVAALRISDDATQVTSKVRGSGREVYSVDITLERGDDGLDDIIGDCTCPVGYNCKHVAATLLEALSGRWSAAGTVSPAPISAMSSAATQSANQPLPFEITAWLERIGKASRGNDYPADVVQRLLYILKPEALGQQIPHPALSLLSARLLKGGSLSNNVSSPSLSGFDPDRAAKYYRDIDIEIIGALSRERTGYGIYYGGQPVRSTDLLRQMTETGRAYWLDHKRAPLSWGETRQGRIEWKLASAAGVRPHLIVDGAITLNAEPPVYIDEKAGMIGPVELGLPARLAHQFLEAPALAPHQVALVARSLGQKLPDIRPDLLPSEPEPAVTISGDPTPVLRLGLGRRPTYGYYYGREPPARMPVARLGFRYGPVEIARLEKAMKLEVFHGGRLFEIRRQRGRENEALKLLKESDFVDARTVYPYLDGTHHGDFTLAEPHDWLDFLNHYANGLRARGFDIQIDDDFPYRLAKSSDGFDAGFESTGIDWFELDLGIEIDGERRDLAPILAALVGNPGFTPALLQGMAEEGGDLYLPMADGRYLALAAERFLPLILALHALNLNGSFIDASGKIKLSRADLVPLLALEDETFTFKGADNLRRMASLLGTGGIPEPGMPDTFKAVLRPYQAHGVAWLDLLRESGLGGILADDMGLGKTVQILALLALEKARGACADPSLIVAPTSLMANWFNEARKFAPDLKVLILHGATRQQSFADIADYDVVLTTYPLIARDHETLLARTWHMAILDEAQTIKNPNAATTRWLRTVAARHRFCLSGTPMENHLGELWSLMSFVNPGYLGDKAAFARNWRTPIEKRGDAGRSMALTRRVKPFLLRRTKAEVATELPPKTEIVETVLLEGKQRDLYDSIRVSMSAKVQKAIKDRGLAKSHIIVLEALLKLRQVCCDPKLLKLDDGIDRPSAKLERLMEMVDELLSEGRKILVFSQFTSMLALVQARFDAASIDYSLLTGDTRDRPGAIDRFQSGACDVFLVSLKAGGVGLNLTMADTVIIFDPWWNPAVEEQAIDRAHRIGQNKSVFVYRLVAAGTIEEKMGELKARKRALADSLFDRDGQIGSALTEADVTTLFEA
ncbi:DEAD/DEAH box helicase [Sphingomonas oligophenolica]|uniref:DEAD/DEAH box helicase n=1 Tax=Sphingomonas oligophenolica TaxID=301154 RepID=A0ABU9XX83_9SPHN